MKLGTIIKLGNHTLIYGDATNKKYYKNITEKVDLLLTDPPYNVNYRGASKKKRRRLMNDALGKRYEQFVESFLLNTQEVMQEGAVYYIFCASTEIHTYSKVLASLNFYQSHQLVWVKNHFVLSFADYKAKHEHILYGWKKKLQYCFKLCKTNKK